jgi:hypothetical protein
MLSSAHVQSVAVLGEFRAAVIVFRADAQDALSSLAMDVRRAHDWLADQRRYWERAVKECYDEVVHAKAELVRRLDEIVGQVDAVLASATGFSGWLFQAAWVPQHLTSASCVVLAILLLSQYAQHQTDLTGLFWTKRFERN